MPPAPSVPADPRSIAAPSGGGPIAPQGARQKGAALWVAVVAMATVSFNMTRVAGVTVSDLLFLACACVVIAKLILGDERYLTPRRYRSGSQLAIAGIVIVITGATLSSFGSWAPLSSMMVVIRLAWSSLVWFWILRSICPDREALFSLVKAWRFTILVSAVVALLGEYAGVSFNSVDFGNGRQAGLTFHPGELMNFLIGGLFLFLVPVYWPSQRSTRRFATAWWALGTAVVMLAIFSTGSTSALLAIAIAGFVVFAASLYAGQSGVRRRSTPLVPMALAGCAIVGLAVLLSSDLAIAERLTSYNDGSGNLDESIASRTSVNEAILGDFDKYLVIGVGPAFFGGAAENLVSNQGGGGAEYGNIHNMHVKMLYESGLPALIGLWLVIFTVGRQSLRLVIATRRTELYPVALMFLGAFVAANVSSMFGPVSYARHFWLPFALVGCLWVVRRRELQQASLTALAIAHDQPRHHASSTTTAFGRPSSDDRPEGAT